MLKLKAFIILLILELSNLVSYKNDIKNKYLIIIKRMSVIEKYLAHELGNDIADNIMSFFFDCDFCDGFFCKNKKK